MVSNLPIIANEVILEVAAYHPTTFIKNIGFNILSKNSLVNLADIIIKYCSEKQPCCYFLIEKTAYCDENLLYFITFMFILLKASILNTRLDH